MRTETAFNRSKLTKIMSYEAYCCLAELLKSYYPTNPYPPAPENYFYKNTAHRMYRSKFLESVICKVAQKDGFDARTIETTGRRVDNREIVEDCIGRKKLIGSTQYIKDHSKKVGEPDTLVRMYGVNVYFEVKVSKDRLSPEQKQFIANAANGGYIVRVIKTVDDFFEAYYNIKSRLHERNEKIKQLGLGL